MACPPESWFLDPCTVTSCPPGNRPKSSKCYKMLINSGPLSHQLPPQIHGFIHHPYPGSAHQFPKKNTLCLILTPPSTVCPTSPASTNRGHPVLWLRPTYFYRSSEAPQLCPPPALTSHCTFAPPSDLASPLASTFRPTIHRPPP